MEDPFYKPPSFIDRESSSSELSEEGLSQQEEGGEPVPVPVAALKTTKAVKAVRPRREGLSAMDKWLSSTLDRWNSNFPWHRLPACMGFHYLNLRRGILQRNNLIHVGPYGGLARSDSYKRPFRSMDGKNYLSDAASTGEQGSFFGRNMPEVPVSLRAVEEPSPILVVQKLLQRKEKGFIPSKNVNVLAAAWVQFMAQDWLDHKDNDSQSYVQLKAPTQIAAQCPLRSFAFFSTTIAPTLQQEPDPAFGSINGSTPWWDGSVVYGSTEESGDLARTRREGKLVIGDGDLLALNPNNNVQIPGDPRNSWVGIALLQNLFVLEHNLVCDMLKAAHPEWEDKQLYDTARLVVSAILAKIHTLDWSTQFLRSPAVQLGLRRKWYGLLGRRMKRLLGHTGSMSMSGVVGAWKPRDHGVPFSITEEVASVNRMHSLLPDEIELRNPWPRKLSEEDPEPSEPPVYDSIPTEDLIGTMGLKTYKHIGPEAFLVSMGYQAAGALQLWNYPEFLRRLIPQNEDGTDRRECVDLAALEVYRDRERGVPRYNAFRRNLRLKPIGQWKDLADDPATITALQEVYGNDVETLDLLPGLMAEPHIPGFEICETAFHVSLLMSVRRLEADPFFTTNYSAKVYSKEGIQWVEDTEGLADVLKRHYPDIVDKWLYADSAFAIWSSPPGPPRHCCPC